MSFLDKFKKDKQPVDAPVEEKEIINGIYEVKVEGEKTIFCLSGKIDVTVTEATKNQILEEMQGNDVVLDVNDVTYTSSAGLRMFFELKLACTGIGRKLEIQNVNPGLYGLFKTTGYADVLNVEPKGDDE